MGGRRCRKSSVKLLWPEQSEELRALSTSLGRPGGNELTDMILVCEGAITFRAHRFVLAGASHKMRKIFTELARIPGFVQGNPNLDSLSS